MIHLSCLQPAAHADDWLAWKVSTDPRGMLCPSPEGTRRVRTRSRETRLAARSIVTCRTGTPREAHFPRLADNEKAMLRSQRGGLALSATPSSPSSRIEPHLWCCCCAASFCPSLLSLAPSDVAVQPTCLATIAQRAPEQECWGGGASPSRALPPGCREGGARLSSNVMVRDLDLRAPDMHDGRRLEVVAEGLPLFGGALVSALNCDGSARPHAADVDGVALSPRRGKKKLTYPELVGLRSRARLVVLAGEVGGRWSAETMSYLGLLAKARTRSETHLKSRRVEQAWRIPFAASLLEQRVSIGCDGKAPVSHEVVADHWYAGLG